MTDNEKTTALIPSVGADGGQPPHNSTNQRIPHETCESNPPEENIEEMREKIRRMNDPHYLHTVSMTELYQTAYKSRPPVIDSLLYSGAYILAGAPKIGKSFLVAQLAYHVSTGQRLWGYEVHQGTVLYLALEDDFQRIQSRMFMMYGVADTASLHFATAANKIGNGLDEQLENFIKEHPDTKLVIIDTMQKIREAGGEAYSYASDYEIIGKLKRFADRHSICRNSVYRTCFCGRGRPLLCRVHGRRFTAVCNLLHRHIARFLCPCADLLQRKTCPLAQNLDPHADWYACLSSDRIFGRVDGKQLRHS